MSKIITTFQAMFYSTKQIELTTAIEDLETYLNTVNEDLLTDLCNDSMIILKDKLARKYGANQKRKIFNENDLWKIHLKF
ncbi:hypothetical protein SD457_09645 [Coprobacillaceae bacterium CR2/5/TPMF4]|nr:hypothetical protein SD457_09645 [Coprobacillaceae bacterium CR2/5/TPMF4]